MDDPATCPPDIHIYTSSKQPWVTLPPDARAVPEFYDLPTTWSAESLERLRADADLVVIEGAGSPAEINLVEGEIVNMQIARLADAPVLLVGDIDRGGVFASLVGTLALLEPADRARVRGLIINKFRGDRSLLEPGLDMLTAHTGVPVLGVIPYVADVALAAEDSLDLDVGEAQAKGDALEVAVVRLPHIANFDDLDPLACEPGVRVRFVTSPGALSAADVVVLPGSKATVADLAWLRSRGLDAAIVQTAREGRPVLGLCGGFQMLGTRIDDPEAVESRVPWTEGLGLLPVVTTFAAQKITVRVRARVAARCGLLAMAAGTEVDGYEIHAGRTDIAPGVSHVFEIVRRGGREADGRDGAMTADGAVLGTYLHGLFTSGPVRAALLRFLAHRAGRAVHPRWGRNEGASAGHDRLADTVGAALDMKAIAALVGLGHPG